MDGGEPKCSPEEKEEPLMVRPLAGVGLVDAPILLLVYFHKAIREEFAELRCLAVEALETGSHNHHLVLDLHRRFDFLKLVYKYHCSAEDEVIFQALDGYIKNVVCTYSLEHKSIDDLFDSISRCLNVLTKEDENMSKTFQELVFCVGTTQTIICQHMVKEEEQVFPLLMQQFAPKEQALLVWQFMCSVPMMLLEDFLRWMTSFLSPDEQVGVMHCIEEVLPTETLLQKVVISWLAKKKRYFETLDKYEKGGEFPYGLFNSKDMLKLHLFKSHSGEEQQLKNIYPIHTTNTGSQNSIDGIHLWHSAIKKGSKEILEELYQLRGSDSFSTLASVTAQLKFFADVLIFYSNALDKIVYVMVNELAKSCLTPSYKRFMDESQIEGLQKLLYCKVQIGTPLSSFVEQLCKGLELFVRDTGKHLIFLETEVFPFIRKNCSHGFQQWLLYTSLHMMPFGLLRCTVTWFSTHLSEDEYKLILYSIEQGGPVAYKSFESLLYEWVRNGYSGKISIEKFRKDLQEMFNSRNSFLSQHIKEDSEFPSLQHDTQSWNRSNPVPLEPNSGIKAKNCAFNSLSSSSNTAEKYGDLYFSGINLNIFFPQMLKNIRSLSKLPVEPSAAGTYFNLESRPIDFIFFFHKALKKDLEYLVFVSANLAENFGLLSDFLSRFHLLRFLYQIHSDSEDEIAFPALELKRKLQNISHSYTIDHKLEVEHFNKISFILDKISKLHVSVSGGNVDPLDERRLRYHQQCVKLQDMCKSMHKMLCDHVHREEIELWPLFRECLSIEEQEKIIGRILGRTRAETLQEIIPWLMASLTPDEQNAIMSLWRKSTKNTMFDEWLGEWWDGMKGYDIAKVEEEPNVPPSCAADPLEVVSTYFSKEGFVNRGNICNKGVEFPENDLSVYNNEPSGTLIVDDRARIFEEDQYGHQSSDCNKFSGEVDKKRCNEIAEVPGEADKRGQDIKVNLKFRHQEDLLIMSQEELEAAIRRVSRDSNLVPQKKSYIIQNLLMSRWIITQQRSHSEVAVSSDEEEVPGWFPSYRDPPKSIYGCKHYKRNCKILAACCNKLYACIRCHDDMVDHSINRKSITNMMCMKCLVIQPIGPTCSTVSCSNLSMARYYCRICKLFDDEREIYHCPYCNLCRVGKGLGVDYFHCMNCNACMSRSLSVHICREKCLEENCPICREYIFTSSAPVKALPCGHLMHSACFQDYTCTHYTCPICSKSLGDMQVYFGMLDALLAEQKITDEYSGQTQVILCNDCEKRGPASFHWLYHKCSYCGSYNTRLL